ncbi:MAG: hypothetical protein F6J93_01365 [Oscillatoria sp. SIO1A7]|nr:hypothetical protein [Oscillatoria sp. SIO1A7]
MLTLRLFSLQLVTTLGNLHSLRLFQLQKRDRENSGIFHPHKVNILRVPLSPGPRVFPSPCPMPNAPCPNSYS